MERLLQNLESIGRISGIGIYVGFPSQSYFGRVFKKYTGSTPMKYRNDCMWRECSAE